MKRSEYKEQIKKLQLKMLRIQQGMFQKKQRLIIIFEGFDAAGKGGAIKRLTKHLDPRGFRVYSIAAPDKREQGIHYLYRFWKKLPEKGSISIFDRSWYGRVLVERVEEFASKEAWSRAYREINEFERLLTDDGVFIIKFFMKISKDEQLRRFEKRLNDPYRQWKLTEEDIRNRAKWDDYTEAVKDMLNETDSKSSPWYVIETDNKEEARIQVMETITKRLEDLAQSFDKKDFGQHTKVLRKALEALS